MTSKLTLTAVLMFGFLALGIVNKAFAIGGW
jgi:hypothetical protein